MDVRTFAIALALCSVPALAQSAAGEAAGTYKIEVSPGLKLKKGEAGEARVTVVPRSDAHVSPEAPISMTLSGGPAVQLPKQKLGRADAKETPQKGVEFAVPVVGKAGGKDEVKGQLSFFICTDKLCERQKRDVSVPVTVE
jgi:hypothetical protein